MQRRGAEHPGQPAVFPRGRAGVQEGELAGRARAALALGLAGSVGPGRHTQMWPVMSATTVSRRAEGRPWRGCWGAAGLGHGVRCWHSALRAPSPALRRGPGNRGHLSPRACISVFRKCCPGLSGLRAKCPWFMGAEAPWSKFLAVPPAPLSLGRKTPATAERAGLAPP